MKASWTIPLALLLLACQSKTQQTVQLKTQLDSMSYMIGMDIGKNLQAQSIEVNADALAQGLQDVLAGRKTTLTDEQMQDLALEFQSQMSERQEKKMREQSEKNKKEGETFLAENKKKQGVTTLTSGLQYKILKKGTGKKPKASDTVTVHYRGRLIDGTEFQSSFKRGEPATFPVNSVIKGWVEALQLMPVGSMWELYVPPELGYGEQGAGQVIGPNQTLIFEIELLSIQ